MRFLTILIAIISTLTVSSIAQVTISDIDNDDDPDSSAALDVRSETRGFLPPRLSTFQMNAIQFPAAGLIIFNTTINSLYYFDGQRWRLLFSRDHESCGDIDYEGQIYQTVIIGRQCWMKENLNVGDRIDGTMDPQDDDNIEKYCYSNEEDSCTKYGGLYHWDEMMNYDTVEVVRGICPPGWHIPSDHDWCILAEYIDPLSVCDNTVVSDSLGKRLRSTTGWHPLVNATDEWGFSALPSGTRDSDGSFDDVFNWVYFWTSTRYPSDKALMWYIITAFDGLIRADLPRANGCSVRCVKD